MCWWNIKMGHVEIGSGFYSVQGLHLVVCMSIQAPRTTYRIGIQFVMMSRLGSGSTEHGGPVSPSRSCHAT